MTMVMEQFSSYSLHVQLEVSTCPLCCHKQSPLSFPVALVRHVLKHTPIPYTVILIVLGLAFGAATTADELSFLHDFTGMARMNPHLMLYVFLPTLIFESAFVMDVHTFKRTLGQAVILAGPGLILCTFLTSLMGRYIFTYNWSWVTALMFGSICSATDPVAVVALLKDLGKWKALLFWIFVCLLIVCFLISQGPQNSWVQLLRESPFSTMGRLSFFSMFFWRSCFQGRAKQVSLQTLASEIVSLLPLL